MLENKTSNINNSLGLLVLITEEGIYTLSSIYIDTFLGSSCIRGIGYGGLDICITDKGSIDELKAILNSISTKLLDRSKDLCQPVIVDLRVIVNELDIK